jgi:hypothetical protein
MIYNITDSTFISNGALVDRTAVKIRQYDNRLWVVCDDGSVVFSNNGDTSTFDAGNIILAPNWEKIIDFLPVQGGVILITRTSVYALYGSGTYQDTSIILIEDNLMLSDSAVVVDNVVYVLGNRGVHMISLNGIREIPQDQVDFFSANYPAWNAIGVAVQGIYLYRFHSILYLFQSGYSAQGFLYSLENGAFEKVNRPLASALPYMMELANSKTDFLISSDSGTAICRSVYPTGTLSAARTSILQFRHEDAGTRRDKIWKSISIVAGVAVSSVTLSIYLDHSDTPTVIQGPTFDLAKGDNVIELLDANDNHPCSRYLSAMLTINTTGPFTIKEVGLVFCETGIKK